MYVGPDHPIFGQTGPDREFYGGPPTLPRFLFIILIFIMCFTILKKNIK